MPVVTRAMAARDANTVEVPINKEEVKGKKAQKEKKKVQVDTEETSSPAGQKAKRGRPRKVPEKSKVVSKSKGGKRGRPKKNFQSNESADGNFQLESKISPNQIGDISPSSDKQAATSIVQSALDECPESDKESIQVPTSNSENENDDNAEAKRDLTFVESPRNSIRFKDSDHPKVSTVPTLPKIPEVPETSPSSSRECEEINTPKNRPFDGFKTPVSQKTMFFVKPGSSSVRRSLLQPHEELVQKPLTPWEPPPITPASSFRKIPRVSQTYSMMKKETPKTRYFKPQLNSFSKSLLKAEGSKSANKKKVNFHAVTKTSDIPRLFVDGEEAEFRFTTATTGNNKCWTVPRKVTPATQEFKIPATTKSGKLRVLKQISFVEATFDVGNPNDTFENRSPWVPPRNATPAKSTGIVTSATTSSACSSSVLESDPPITPVPHSGKPISRRLLTFSAEKKNKVDEGESESSVGYNVTEYEDLESSQEAPEVYEFRKLDRRATKKIPSWAIGEQLKIGLVQMIPLVDSVNKNYFIPRIFPPLREVNPSFSLYPAFGLARLSESPFAEQKDEEIKVPSVGNNEIVV